MEKEEYSVSEAVRLIGVESHVLRYWEEELQITIRRNSQGYRVYSPENIRTFCRVKELKDQGIQLRAIRVLFTECETESGRENARSVRETESAFDPEQRELVKSIRTIEQRLHHQGLAERFPESEPGSEISESEPGQEILKSEPVPEIPEPNTEPEMPVHRESGEPGAYEYPQEPPQVMTSERGSGSNCEGESESERGPGSGCEGESESERGSGSNCEGECESGRGSENGCEGECESERGSGSNCEGEFESGRGSGNGCAEAYGYVEGPESYEMILEERGDNLRQFETILRRLITEVVEEQNDKLAQEMADVIRDEVADLYLLYQDMMREAAAEREQGIGLWKRLKRYLRGR